MPVQSVQTRALSPEICFAHHLQQLSNKSDAFLAETQTRNKSEKMV